MKFRYTLTNRQVKHYLIQWYDFDKNIHDLTDMQRKKMKTLYAGLKELKPEERKLLAVKYRVKKRPYIKDSIVAESLGMTEKEYSKKRIAIEDKLRVIFNRIIKEEENAHKELIPMDLLDTDTRLHVQKAAIMQGISEERVVKEILKKYASDYVSQLSEISMTVK